MGHLQSRRGAADPNKSTTALRALKVVEVLAEARAPLAASEVAAIIGTDAARPIAC